MLELFKAKLTKWKGKTCSPSCSTKTHLWSTRWTLGQCLQLPMCLQSISCSSAGHELQKEGSGTGHGWWLRWLVNQDCWCLEQVVGGPTPHVPSSTLHVAWGAHVGLGITWCPRHIRRARVKAVQGARCLLSPSRPQQDLGKWGWPSARFPPSLALEGAHLGHAKIVLQTHLTHGAEHHRAFPLQWCLLPFLLSWWLSRALYEVTHKGK